ncbi:type II toxin-antitoxin system VapC family toxin [Agrococcus beijingensis]|uniref:type II toxin-antitoxin system VapC family toxin n=1 Tax=Agrococcus beijingensis TaxID=3068634 RepID=UPI0027404B6C|nr:PIN domain nuclease [Agrococcus sp. REN33]
MLVDTSAWVEYLRGTGSVTNVAVRDRIRESASLVTCDPVVMEVLAGGRSEQHVLELRGLLARAELVATMPSDWDDAARIYRAGRRQGVTIRKLVDCLIAAIALRRGEPVLHHDADFDAIARVVPLVVARG